MQKKNQKQNDILHKKCMIPKQGIEIEKKTSPTQLVSVKTH